MGTPILPLLLPHTSPHSPLRPPIMRFSNSVSTFQLATAATLFSALAIKTVAASPLLTVRQEDNGDDNDNDNNNNNNNSNGGMTTSDNDDGILLSPTNATVAAPGGTIQFSYRVQRDDDNDDDDDDDSNDGPTAVDVVLVQVITLAKGLMLERDANGSYVNAQLALPANLPAGNWAIGVDELDDDDDSMNSAVNATARNTTSPDDLDDFDYTFRTGQDRNERASYVYLTVGDDGTQNTTGATAGAATTSAAATTPAQTQPAGGDDNDDDNDSDN